MFTGIIETIGIVQSYKHVGNKIHFWLTSSFTNELKLGESISHDGVCLTVTELQDNLYSVTTIDTTLETTNINWQPGTKVNLERALSVNSRLDGHIVQGHVDSIGIIKDIEKTDGSIKINIEIEPQFNKNIVEKGSICVNGISLTIVSINENSFMVAIIPHTWQITNLHQLKIDDTVNLEFDILGKYVERLLQYKV
jgi:riboflavin synthase